MDVRPDDGSRLPGTDPAALAAEVERLRAEVDHLHRALSSRAVIEQAKGILAERTRCSPEAAFDLLDQMSQRRNVKLRRIAAEVVTERGGSVPTALLDVDADDDADPDDDARREPDPSAG